MHERSISITAPYEWAPAWLLVVVRASLLTLLVGARPSFAQPVGPTITQMFGALDYAAPVGCPPRAEFEHRLRLRLGHTPQAARADGRLSVRLTHAVQFHGAIVLSDRHGVLGERSIEAASCSEAVDALVFVATLLLEDRARSTRSAKQPSGRAAQRTTDGSERSSHGASRTATAADRAAGDRAPPAQSGRDPDDEAATASAGGTQPAASESARASGSTTAVEGTSSPRAPTQTSEPAHEPRNAARLSSTPEAPELRRSDRGPASVAPAAARFDALSLSVAALLVSGIAPALRPGLGLFVDLSLWRRAQFQLSIALGAGATLPHTERTPEGHGAFAWWSGMLALCAGTSSATRAVVADLCLSGEAGQVIAEGRATADPDSINALWRALGPAARLRLRVTGPLWVAPNLSLMFPLADDRFVVGDSTLHRVPSLTFRAALAIGVQLP